MCFFVRKNSSHWLRPILGREDRIKKGVYYYTPFIILCIFAYTNDVPHIHFFKVTFEKKCMYHTQKVYVPYTFSVPHIHFYKCN